MQHNELKELIRKYTDGTCTPEERMRVESWYLRAASKIPALEREPIYDDVKSDMWAALEHRIQGAKRRSLRWGIYAAAACVLMACAISFWWFKKANEPILPGTVSATLTAADGAVYALDEQQEALDFSKVTEKAEIEISQDNVVSTPRGGEYSLKLPDGSVVWLNAESKLTFPATFADSARIVSLIGEAYFEVAKDPNRPFRVQVNDATVEVLGTHFNIENYSQNDVFKTTLVEGAVQVKKAGHSQILKPGQQAIVATKDAIIRIEDQVDTDKITAWKEGFFEFKNDAIDDILSQVGRWYQVDIRYMDGVPDKRLTGKIPRKSRFEQVLDILAYSGIQYQLEGKTLIIR